MGTTDTDTAIPTQAIIRGLTTRVIRLSTAVVSMSVVAAGTDVAAGTADAGYKLTAVCCAASSGSARIGGVRFPASAPIFNVPVAP